MPPTVKSHVGIPHPASVEATRGASPMAKDLNAGMRMDSTRAAGLKVGVVNAIIETF